MDDNAVKKYEAKTGEKFRLGPNESLYDLGKEFMAWKLGARDGVPFFWIGQMFGQMIHFRDFIRSVCADAGIEFIVTATTRDPKAHLKKWKMDRLPEEDYDFENRHYYVLKGYINNL